MQTKQNNLAINDHVIILDTSQQFYMDLRYKTGVIKKFVGDGYTTHSLVYLDNTNIEVMVANIYLRAIPDRVFTEWIDYNNLPQFILSYNFDPTDTLMLFIFNTDFNWEIENLTKIRQELSKLNSNDPYKQYTNYSCCRFEFKKHEGTDLFYQITQIEAIIKDHNILLLRTELCNRYDLFRQMECLMVREVNYYGHIKPQGTYNESN